MNDDDNEVDLLKNQIQKLNLELDKKDKEVHGYLEKIHNLEEELIELHGLFSKTPSQQNLQNAIESKFNFELKEKEREIRELKDRMGFLRKEKNLIQRELDEIKKKSKASVISVEEIREKEKLTSNLIKLETVTTELQRKLHREEALTRILKNQIEEKNKQIEQFNLNIEKLNQELLIKDSIKEGKVSKTIKKELNKGLQKELTKCKKRIKDLKIELAEYKKPEKEKIKNDIELSELKIKFQNLIKELERKDKEIDELKFQKKLFRNSSY
ncbi:MAG: hypothetical protein ACFE9T_01965 [Promethearchaeota archaeon]